MEKNYIMIIVPVYTIATKVYRMDLTEAMSIADPDEVGSIDITM